MNLNTLRDMGTRLRLGLDIDQEQNIAGGGALHDQADNAPREIGLFNVFQLDGMRMLTAAANLKPAGGKPRLVSSGSSNSARFADADAGAQRKAGLALADRAPHPCA